MGPVSRRVRATLTIGVLLAACGPSIHVETDYSKQVSFPEYKTYAFANVPASAASQNRLDPLMTEHVRGALDQNLPGRGLTKASDSASADLLILAWGTSKEKMDVQNWGYAYGGYRWGGMYGPTNTTVNYYNEGTLVVDFIDPRKKQLVWRGTATGTVNDRNEANRVLEQAVGDMLRQYPPKP